MDCHHGSQRWHFVIYILLKTKRAWWKLNINLNREEFLLFFYLWRDNQLTSPYFYPQCIDGKDPQKASSKPSGAHPCRKVSHSAIVWWAFVLCLKQWHLSGHFKVLAGFWHMKAVRALDYCSCTVFSYVVLRLKSNILVDPTLLNTGKILIKLFQCSSVHFHQSYLFSQRVCALHLISVAVRCSILIKQKCGCVVNYCMY